MAGVSYEPYDGVITTFEIDNELGQELQYHGGLEMMVVTGFALRAGVMTNPNKLTGGLRLHLRRLRASTTASPPAAATLDSTHQFGLNFAWGGEAQ